MHKIAHQIRYSASDVVAFLGCQHRTALDLIDLDTKLTRAPVDEQMKLIQDKGYAHEDSFLASLKARGGRVVTLSSSGSMDANLQATREAMASGADIVFQAALAKSAFMGYADFLMRVETPSDFGSWSYEVADTKLAHRAQPKFMIQLAHYSELLANMQGAYPQHMHLVLGNRVERSFRVQDYLHYYRRLRQRFDAFLANRPATSPEQCDQCSVCDWRERCAGEWLEADHLNQVANASKQNIHKLRRQGISTLAALGSLPASQAVPTLSPETLKRLRDQARLQLSKRQTGDSFYETLESNAAGRTGFDSLPPPNEGDLFFDMEGNPLDEGGLEYLFGVFLRQGNQWVFKDFWAHDRAQEKKAFCDFIDFVMQRLAVYPQAHVYHYAHYEPTALKRLMSVHGVREAEVDQLLRQKRFIDLYKVVTQSVRISEPRYSIKNLETFYMDKRQGDVTNAGASIVFYENWRKTQDPSLLQKIRDYNEDDCRSTYLLHDWLLSIRPAASATKQAAPGAAPGEPISEETDQPEKGQKIRDHEALLASYEQKLLSGVPGIAAEQTDAQRVRVLMNQLLDFHRRAAKPAWWSLFSRQEMTPEELLEDPECIAGLKLLNVQTGTNSRSQQTARYTYPEQDFKLRSGDECVRTDTSESLGKLGDIHEGARTLDIKISARKQAPASVSISTGGPINTDVISKAVFRQADALLASNGKFQAALDFLAKAAPRITGHTPGHPIIDETRPAQPQIIDAVARLDHSTLFIQGPPGAGKTFTGSRLIANLLSRGHSVGVSSNSHKAIHNLLEAVEKESNAMRLQFSGAYKGSSQSTGSDFVSTRIKTMTRTEDITRALSGGKVKLVAGTAWLFSAPDMEQKLDYLFVDEAGQLATANLLAMMTSSSNVILLGDQMQLGQPTQGVHPGESGLSALDFLLEGQATIAPDRGIFLATTWRMHEDVCRFISDAVYDGRLQPEPDNARQRLVLNNTAHPLLRPTGLVHVPAVHEGCAQRSEEEASIVADLYNNLLTQRYQDRHGQEHAMCIDNILVVAPYNMQVDLLRRKLPPGARVGTVDKFQGQEAEVAIVSMATSNSDSMPRHIEFLYSKNRLNVAISRARCLALLVASPALADISCSTVEQMGLVNLLCKVVGHGNDLSK